MATSYDYVNQQTLDTELIYQRDVDSFFSPETLGHIGFAANGVWYDSGVADSSRLASWFTEPLGTTVRGDSSSIWGTNWRYPTISWKIRRGTYP
jgi:hypothetical protein